jgi:indole-3-glycerol phosphate synthase
MTSDRSAIGSDLLGTIVAGTRRIVELREEREPLSQLTRRAEQRASRGGRFRAALCDGPEATADSARARVSAGNGRHAVPHIIAECKRRSPSRGVLRPDYDPVAIAKGYVEAGAVAISVLTEPTFFDGALEHLQAIDGAVDVPLLRKDFIVSEYQLVEAKAAGADAVLLIVAALEPGEVARLQQCAATLGLDVLVEVHTAEELAIAIDAGAGIIGVNNRNLRTLDVDVRASEALISRMPPNVVAVSESGLRTADDLGRLQELGYRAFLIGERFMTAVDPGGALKALLDQCS